MPKTNTAVFAQHPRTAATTLTNAVAVTGVGSIQDANDAVAGTRKLFTAGAEGAIVTRLRFLPRGTISATSVYVFVRKAGDAADVRRLIDSALLSAITVSTTSRPVPVEVTSVTEQTPLRLEAGDEVYIGISVAATPGITAYAELTDF